VQDLTEDADQGWQAAVHDYIPVLPVVLAAAFATWFYREHLRHD
jgi:hypothetical protein